MSSDGVSGNRPAQGSIQISDLKNLTPDQINEKISGLSQSEQDAIWAQLRGTSTTTTTKTTTTTTTTTGTPQDAGAVLNGSANAGNIGRGLAEVNGGSVFGNSNMIVDGQRLTDVTNQFMNFTNYSGGLSFGLGSNAMSTTIGNWFQQVWNCFSFTDAFSRITGSTTLASGETTLLAPEEKPDVTTEVKEEKTEVETETTTASTATPAAKPKPAAKPAAPALPKSIKAGNLTITGDWVKKAVDLKPGATMEVPTTKGQKYKLTKGYDGKYTSTLISEKTTRPFKANVRTTKLMPNGRQSGDSYEMQYPTGNSLYKSPTTRLGVDSDAILQVGSNKYNIKRDIDSLSDVTLDYYSITNQRSFGAKFDLVSTKDGTFNPRSEIFNTSKTKKIYLSSIGEKGKFDGCEIKPLRDMNGTWRTAIIKDGQYFDLNELVKKGAEVTFRPGTFLEQG